MDDHTHQFEELKLFKIVRVHKGYNGTSGDKAFITKRCHCGKVSPVEYGLTKTMQKRIKELEKVNGLDHSV